MPQTMNSGAKPVPTVVYLSGSMRGTTLRLSDEALRIGTDRDADVFLPSDTEPLPAPHHATLVLQDQTYHVRPEPGREVWVNGKETAGQPLASGDVLEIGRDGAILRFRLYPPGSRAYKSLPQVFSDCWGCARNADGGGLRKLGVLLKGVPAEVMTQTSGVFRATMVVVMAVLTVSTVYLSQRGRALEDQLATQMEQLTGIAQLLENTRGQAVTDDDLTDLLSELEGRLADPNQEATETADLTELLQQVRSGLQETNDRVQRLEARTGASARVIAAAAQSTAFVQGSYGFVDRAQGRTVRLVVGPDGRPVLNPRGRPAITVEGDGPPLEILYTGTGFIASADGLLLTNRHVAIPWDFDQSAQQLISAGFLPEMRRFVAYLPGVTEPFDLTTIRASDDADIAVLRCDGTTAGMPFLPLRATPPKAGEEVLVLGYPLGMRAMLARAGREVMEQLRLGGGAEFWEVAEHLSTAGRITPLASRGIVGQVTNHAVVYDAETTSGGSGGPVLDLDGNVIAINAAILPEFGGSNIGVPSARARALLGNDR